MYPVSLSAVLVCRCGALGHRILVDEDAGVALRVCSKCQTTHALGDSEEFMEGAEPEECECPCGGTVFEGIVGASLYSDGVALRWVYLGLECVSCREIGVYADWKNEDDDAARYLRNI